MSDGPPFRYCGRDFDAAEIDWIRALIAQRPTLRRAALSRALCERLGWRKPDGGLKDMSARVAMLRMHRDGLIALPPPRNGPRTMRPPPPAPATGPPPSPPPADLDEVRPVRVQPVADGAEGRRWNAFVAHHHYLGYTPLPGAQLRYFARAADGRPLALFGFGAAAWKTAPRDRFVGWTPERRRRNLPLVVNNARFLILPWIRIPNLASHLLAQVERRLPDDWHRRYAIRPVLLETFCETPRFDGAAYRGANWIPVGRTQGRGKLDRRHEFARPVKIIYLKPLRPDWKDALNR